MKKEKKCHKKQVNASWWADRKNPTPSAGLRERLHVYRAPSVSWWKVNDASLSACGIWFSPNESIMTAPTTTFLWSVRGGEDHKTSPVITEFRIAEVIIPTRKREEEEKKVSIDVGSYSIESLHVMVNLSCKLDSIYLLGFLITWTTLSWCILYKGSMGAGERDIYNTTPVDM